MGRRAFSPRCKVSGLRFGFEEGLRFRAQLFKLPLFGAEVGRGMKEIKKVWCFKG